MGNKPGVTTAVEEAEHDAWQRWQSVRVVRQEPEAKVSLSMSVVEGGNREGKDW